MELSTPKQVTVAPLDPEGSEWWLAFSYEGKPPYHVLPAVPAADARETVSAVFTGLLPVPPVWEKRIRPKDGCYWGSKLPCMTLYRYIERVGEPDTETFAARGLNSHDHEIVVWFHPTMQRRVCGLCYPNASDYGGQWLVSEES